MISLQRSYETYKRSAETQTGPNYVFHRLWTTVYVVVNSGHVLYKNQPLAFYVRLSEFYLSLSEFYVRPSGFWKQIQNRAARITAGASYEINSADVLTVLESLGWVSLERRRQKMKSILLYKILTDYTAPIIWKSHWLG
jgi:hypothetical protein